MKNLHYSAMYLLAVLLLLLSMPVHAQDVHRSYTDEELSRAFDEVARNLGAVEYAVYTFMVEFGRAPESLDELRDSGHLNVVMTNPYTNGEVVSLTMEDYPDGDVAGNILVRSQQDGNEAHVEAWYIRSDEPHVYYVRSMIQGIWLYQSEIDYDYFFNNDNPRDEQMVAVYCSQALDAIDSYVQKIGETPGDFLQMYENGDVNVLYINPITNELAESVDDVSPGDFFYEKIGEDGYVLIGWGREQPVFFSTTDQETEDEFYLEWPELNPDEEHGQNDSEDESDIEREGVPGCK
jgi:hypothetical protein